LPTDVLFRVASTAQMIRPLRNTVLGLLFVTQITSCHQPNAFMMHPGAIDDLAEFSGLWADVTSVRRAGTYDYYLDIVLTNDTASMIGFQKDTSDDYCFDWHQLSLKAVAKNLYSFIDNGAERGIRIENDGAEMLHTVVDYNDIDADGDANETLTFRFKRVTDLRSDDIPGC